MSRFAVSPKRVLKSSAALFVVCAVTALAAELPPNQWIELRRDSVGARPGSAVRYVPETRSFYLWGYMNADPNLLQEHPLMAVPEYDVVAFDPDVGQWRSQREKFGPAYVPRTYSGKTTGSERTVLRGPAEERGSEPRPDLNIVFDQVAYHPGLQSLVYFTGGLTAAYNVVERRWRDLAPGSSAPPVVGGSLAYDPVNDQLVLFGGGHVVEHAANGRIAGYTGTWVWHTGERDWRQWPLLVQPPPRMNTRLVTDTKNQVLVLFGGDAQDRYLADTWIFDLKTQSWRESRAGGPEARAGHFTVYDPETGWVIIGGGYNTKDLADMWAYDAGQDRWRRLPGEVPTGFYLTADIAPERHRILLVTSTRKLGDRMSCNILYPVRSTYAYRIAAPAAAAAESASKAAPILKRPPAPAESQHTPKPVAFPNQWIKLSSDSPSAPARTWGSATFDTTRGLILYWGGGHCGYEGNDVDTFDVAAQSWREPRGVGEYPERLWDRGVRPAGVTFQGAPWTDHGRKTYAYDPVSRKMILVRTIRLTTGYEPEALQFFPARRTAYPDALVSPPSSYVRYATWSYDPESGQWKLLGSGPVGVDTLVSTQHGVMGVNVDWPARLNDAGYQPPFDPRKLGDTAIYLFDAATRAWKRLDEPQQPSPQYLYEMTALAYDSKRDRVLLHGAGPKRDELWAFDLATRRWRNLDPLGAAPPALREAVYIAHEDVLLAYGPAPEDRGQPALWTYKPGETAWRRVDVAPPPGVELSVAAGQNRALVYDPGRDLVYLVLGGRGDQGKAVVYAMRYRHGGARFK